MKGAQVQVEGLRDVTKVVICSHLDIEVKYGACTGYNAIKTCSQFQTIATLGNGFAAGRRATALRLIALKTLAIGANVRGASTQCERGRRQERRRRRQMGVRRRQREHGDALQLCGGDVTRHGRRSPRTFQPLGDTTRISQTSNLIHIPGYM